MTKPLNRIRCAKCLDILTSRHVHDFVTCSCGSVSVDGGNDYYRYVGELQNILVYNNRQWVPLVIEKEEETKINFIQWLRKIFKIG